MQCEVCVERKKCILYFLGLFHVLRYNGEVDRPNCKIKKNTKKN